MGADALAHVLRPLREVFQAEDYPDLIIGLDDPDDAAVLRRSETEAIVATADFFPPVVDDPADYGAIAAANAMSDIFAMGGEVLLALNIAAFPEDLSLDIIQSIIRAAAEQVRAAGGVIAGGHTVIDPEPKFGLCVIGRVRPDAILRKGGARVDDVLLLTKPIGTGVVTTAIKAARADPEHIAAAVASMRRLNRAAGQVAVAEGAHAATDITGFAIAGHCVEVAEASGVQLVIRLADVPLLPGAVEQATAGQIPGGTWRNVLGFESRVSLNSPLTPAWEALAYDPQTSGGLLIAADRAAGRRIVAALEAMGERVWEVGFVAEGRGVRFEVPEDAPDE